jgi:diguanylate cyclase (GGDEF)-like protein
MWRRIRPRFASPHHGIQAELDALVTDEARKGARVVVPFLVPAIYLVRVILADAARRPGVEIALGSLLAVTLGRWGILWALSRRTGPAFGDDARRRARLRSFAFSVSAWLVSAGFGLTYLVAAPSLDPSQIKMLTMVATAVCALATLSMSAVVWSYLGYIAVHLGALVAVMVLHPDPAQGSTLPFMVVVLTIGLTVISARTNRALREKIVLGIKLRDSALRDALTGLRNRHFVSEFVAQVSEQVRSEWQHTTGRQPVTQKRSLALFVVDLDHFKSINDKHGHAAGDRILKAFAELAQSAVRAQDIVARWGGEEFLVIVETRDRDAVRAIGERIRTMVAAYRAIEPGGAALSVTCSVGACLFPFDVTEPDALTWEETLELADRALYEAKRTGRNRTLWLRPGSGGLVPREARMDVRSSARAFAVASQPKIEVLPV